MSILIKDVSLSFGSQIIFDRISCSLNPADRMGLVGANGSGKSTLLRVLAQQQLVDSGVIQYAKGMKIGYMPQELTLTSSETIINEVIKACTVEDSERELLKAQAKKILMGLGFSIVQFDAPVLSLSVGWRMRVFLAQLLLQKADFYLFDEPTNHLDIVAKEWFLSFLKQANFGFILVCHDRYFLDELCETIIECELGFCTKYRGNYSSYEQQKEHRLKILEASYKNQQRDIERKQRTIDRFRAQASHARMVKKMERDLAKIERVVLPSSLKTIHFSFPVVQQPGRIVLEIKNLAFAFDKHQLFKNVSFTLMRGERVAIIAPNGVGKTTLLNVIMAKYHQQQGTVHRGHNVTCAYFEQDQMNVLNPEKTIFQTVSDCAQQVPAQEIRDLLGCFLFSQDFMLKKINILSGGEKNRVCMACALLQGASFLLLDEPTNHLDIQSKEILLTALKEYAGTILFVSHDHYFVQELATSIVELSETGALSYPGTYEEYLDQRRVQVQAHEPAHGVLIQQKKFIQNASVRKVHDELAKLERKIQKLERERTQLHKQFETLIYGTPEFTQATEKLQHTEKMLEQLIQEWEKRYTV